MQIAFAFARKHLAGAAAVLFAAALAVSFVLPVQAHALDVERWTAKPNKDGDNTTVLGATATRVTWQGQTAEGESLASVTIEMPEGTTVGAENVKTTVLVGLDRLEMCIRDRLDNASKLKVRTLIEQLKAEGTTMLGSFHDLEFMEGLCDHEFNMQEGMMA